MKVPGMRIGARRITASPGQPMFWQRKMRDERKQNAAPGAKVVGVDAITGRPIYERPDNRTRRKG